MSNQYHPLELWASQPNSRRAHFFFPVVEWQINVRWILTNFINFLFLFRWPTSHMITFYMQAFSKHFGSGRYVVDRHNLNAAHGHLWNVEKKQQSMREVWKSRRILQRAWICADIFNWFYFYIPDGKTWVLVGQRKAREVSSYRFFKVIQWSSGGQSSYE